MIIDTERFGSGQFSLLVVDGEIVGIAEQRTVFQASSDLAASHGFEADETAQLKERVRTRAKGE